MIGVLARYLARRALPSAAVWAAIFATTVTTSALGYVSAYPNVLDRVALQVSIGGNAGLTALFGPVRTLATVAGFTAWRALGILLIVGGVWGLLAGTRAGRGDEEAGRWENVLAAPLTKRAAAAAAALGALAPPAVVWLVVAAAGSAIGRDSAVGFSVQSSAYFAAVLVGPAVLMLCAGLLAAQLAPTRQRAAALAAAAFGVWYLVRVVAGARPDLAWVGHLTPLGWFDTATAFTGSSWPWLAAAYALAFAFAATAVRLAGARDLGAGLIRDRATRPARTSLLGGMPAFSVRLAVPAALGWASALAVVGAVLGTLSGPVGSAVDTSGSMRRIFEQLGAHGSGAADFLGVTTLVVASAVAVCAAAQASAVRAEEAEDRLEILLAAPVSRRQWVLTRTLVAGTSVLVPSLVVGLSTWAAAAASSAGVGFAAMAAAGVNMVPVALVVLGVGVAAFAVLPRATGPLAYGVVAWSLLDELVGTLVHAPHWVLDTSLLHHMALAPAVDPAWRTNAVLTALGVGLCVVGVIGVRHRDVAGP